MAALNGEFKFLLNNSHPLLMKLLSEIDDQQKELLSIYLKGLQAYLPLDTIQAQIKNKIRI